jgi:hypothetical protein
MQRTTLWRRLTVATVTIGALASTMGLGTVPAHAAAGNLRLFTTKSEVTATRRPHQAAFVNAPVFAAAVGGAFEIQVKRADYASPLEASEWADGVWLRDLDPADIDGWNGLANFIHVTVKNPAGDVVIDRDQGWCPGGYYLQRVNDTGPDIPTLPQFGCYAMPFTIGTVWGLDEGWGVPVNPRYGVSAPLFLNGKDGTYQVRYSFPQAVIDDFGFDPRQSMAKFTVDLRTRHRRTAATQARSAATAADAPAPRVPTDPHPDPSTVPDLHALPSFGMRVSHARDGHDYLSFGANIWNSGPSPMVVEGFRQKDSNVMDAYQYFYDGDTPVGRTPVGTFEFDTRKGHQHWHMEQFAQYSLLNADETEAVRSQKQSFCLAPTDAIDLTIPTADWNPPFYGQDALSTVCGGGGAIWIREVLPVGWGDTYYQYVAGQSFDITHLPNGKYWVQVTANPTGLMVETTMDNNVSLRRVILRGTRGHRRVIVPPYLGLDG